MTWFVACAEPQRAIVVFLDFDEGLVVLQVGVVVLEHDQLAILEIRHLFFGRDLVQVSSTPPSRVDPSRPTT